MNRNHNLAKPMLGDVLIVKQLPQIKVGLGMEDVLIVVNVVVKYGQKECKVVKRNIVNKGTATSSLIVRVSGISPNGLGLGEVAEPKSQIEVQMFKIKNECW